MDYNNIEEKLTPAARQALAELVNDYRKQILLSAMESASKLVGVPREISVHDIIVSLNRFGNRRILFRETFYERILNAYVIFGIAAAILSLLLALLQQEITSIHLGPFTTNELIRASVACFVVSGIFYIIIKSRIFRAFPFASRAARENESPEYIGLFLSNWRELELALRNGASSFFGESRANEPLSKIVLNLTEKGYISSEQRILIKNLLDLRNRIVHEEVRPDFKEVENAIYALSQILKDLHEKQQSPF